MESLFGPPSESIDVPAFVESVVDACSGDLDSVQLPTESVASEYSVAEIRDSLSDTWNNPLVSAHLLKGHEQSIVTLSSSKSSKSRRRALKVPDPDTRPPDVALLQGALEEVKLSSWKLKGDSVSFMRSSKNAEQNAFAQVISGSNSLDQRDNKAIVTITIYDRLSWGAGIVTRASQHALLSSQTLGHVFDLIPCPSSGLAEADMTPTVSSEGQPHDITDADGRVICIDGIAYGNAEKLFLHFQAILKNSVSITKATTTIYQTPLSALLLRINQPYWLLHHGNCEHFIVVDQIRYQHPSDASFEYPLLLQATPPLLDLCRACSKVPAVVSVVGDIRLGESPCLMCGPCWRNMGDSLDTGQTTIPLPRSRV